jgi:hypothetical protein
MMCVDYIQFERGQQAVNKIEMGITVAISFVSGRFMLR